MAGKVLRLSKVAKELNVGITTIVDFLSSKGVEIDSNPNTKLEDHAYELLSNQFAADQSVKEKSKQASMVKERKETISIRDAKEPESEVEDTDDDVEISLEALKAPLVENKPKPVAEEEAPKETKKEEPVAEEKPAKKTPAKKKEASTVPQPSARLPDLSMKRGFYTIMSAQFFSSLADRVSLIERILTKQDMLVVFL